MPLSRTAHTILVSMAICIPAARATAPIDEVRLPILYLHLHKCGGTTACDLFKTRTQLRVDRHPHSNCNCDNEVLTRALRAGDGAALAGYMRAHNFDACAVERLHYWPMPANFALLRDTFGGTLLTTLREPFAHFMSSFERDQEIQKLPLPKRQLELEHALAEYERARKTVRSYNSYDVAYPSFAVRALNGLATLRDGSQHQPKPERFLDGLTVDDCHLAIARDVLSAFTRVLILEPKPQP